MSRRTVYWITTFGFALLVVLHLDFWRPQRVELILGWLPVELAYRLAYCLLAWLYVLFVVRWVWQEERDP